MLAGRESGTMSATRHTEDGPWAWLNKEALRRIRDVAGESNKPSASSVLAVYLGLCELASDSQSDEFEASRGRIASKACVNVRTVDKTLAVLENADVLRVRRRRIDETTNLPSVYTLLSYRSEFKSLPSIP